MVFFLEVVLLRKLQFNNKKMSNKGLGCTSLFLLYSIAGHNNTAIKITNTYSDDQLVIYIFKRQTQQKQWMWATISFKRDRSNSAKERIGDEEQTGGPSLLRREAYLGHERLGSGENTHRTMGREKRKEVLPYSSIPESLASLLLSSSFCCF